MQEKSYNKFVDRFTETAKGLKLGDGLDKDTRMGPLANARRLDAMNTIVADCQSRGGKLADRRQAARQPRLFLRADGGHANFPTVPS